MMMNPEFMKNEIIWQFEVTEIMKLWFILRKIEKNNIFLF